MATFSTHEMAAASLVAACLGALAGVAWFKAEPKDDQLDIQCHIAVGQMLAQAAVEPDLRYQNPDYVLQSALKHRPKSKFEGRFAKAIDGCIAIVSEDLPNNYLVIDLHNSLLRDMSYLFECDRNRMYAVNLAKARQFEGMVSHVKPHDFRLNIPPLDGKDYPRVSLTRDDCKKAVARYLDTLSANPL